MPSPCPGVDPYLEGGMWQEFHETLAAEIRGQLPAHLRPRCVALLAEHSLSDEDAARVEDGLHAASLQ